MYTPKKNKKTTLKVNNAYEGETIEEKVRRIVNNKEPITDGAPLIYTDRKDGVGAQYDIRTDRFEVAIEAMDKVTGSHRAKREERHKKKDDIGEQAKEGMKKEEMPKGQPAPGTTPNEGDTKK